MGIKVSTEVQERLRSAVGKSTSLLKSYFDNHSEESSSETSSDRCGFEIADETLPNAYGGWCCLRKTWREYDRCIWHAEKRGKPQDELAAALSTERQSQHGPGQELIILDGAKLRNLEIPAPDYEAEEAPVGPTVSFGNCRLINADFQYGTLRGTSFDRTIAIGADFKDADLTYRLLQGGDFSDANFRYAELKGIGTHSGTFQNADFIGANLTDANLVFSDCQGASFKHSTLEGTYLHDVDLTESNLEDATMERTDLTGADLTSSKLHKAVVRDVRIDETTEFGNYCWYERTADHEVAETVGSEESKGAVLATVLDRIGSRLPALNRFWSRIRRSQPTDTPSKLAKAIRVYRLYQRIHRQNSLPEPARHFRIRERHARRKQALEEDSYLKWLELARQRWTTLYGEDPRRVVVASISVIVLCALLYPIWGIRTGSRVVRYGAVSIFDAVSTGLYLSATTFSSFGYGDLQPQGWANGLAAVESLLGALAVALFVFVLGRRSSW